MIVMMMVVMMIVCVHSHNDDDDDGWDVGVVKLVERRTRDRKVESSNFVGSGVGIFFPGVNFLC